MNKNSEYTMMNKRTRKSDRTIDMNVSCNIYSVLSSDNCNVTNTCMRVSTIDTKSTTIRDNTRNPTNHTADDRHYKTSSIGKCNATVNRKVHLNIEGTRDGTSIIQVKSDIVTSSNHYDATNRVLAGRYMSHVKSYINIRVRIIITCNIPMTSDIMRNVNSMRTVGHNVYGYGYEE